jgi:hypothetical protein
MLSYARMRRKLEPSAERTAWAASRALPLGWNGFYHSHRRLRCHDAVEAEASLIE